MKIFYLKMISLPKQTMCLVFYCLLTQFLMAQEVPKVITFKRTDYNAAYQNWMMTQDREGYLFVANTSGVLIYNGYQWKLIPLPQHQKPRTVFLGKDGKIYVGAFQAFGYIDTSNRDHPIYHPIADSLLQNSNQEIWNIFGDDDQIIFQSFSNIYIYDYKNIQAIIPPSNVMFGKAINQSLYLPKIEQGLYKIDNQQIIELPLVNTLPEKSKIADLCATSHPEEVMMGTQYNGIFILKKDSLQAIQSDLNEQLKKEQINKVIRLSSGDFVVGTILNGIYVTEDFQHIKYHINKSNGLANNTVLSLYEDHNHDLWVGLDKEINLVKVSEPLTYFYDRQGKLGTIFTSIKYQNTSYLGTNQGVFKSNPDGTFSLINNSQGQIWSFMIMDDDLICGHNKGTFLIKNDEFINISDITGGWWMQAIGEDRILQSTYTGLVILEKKDGRWSVSRVKNTNLLIEKFALSGHRLIGFHSNYGVAVVDLSENFDEVLDTTIINKIGQHELNKGVNLLSTQENIVLSFDSTYYQFEENTFQKISPQLLKSLLKDEFFASQYQFYNAIYQISTVENITVYQFFKPQYSQNEFMIGFDEGYILIPRSFEAFDKEYTSLEVDYVRADHQIFDQPRSLSLSPSQNDMTIQIKDFSFRHLSTVAKYKLNHWDDEWHNIPPNGQLNFIKLNDGKYDLYLMNGKNDAKKVLQFTIAPHWYESWPGGILYGLMAIFLFSYFNNRHQKKLRRQAEKLQNEKQKEIESERIKAKNDQLEREVIYKSKMLANSTMALVQKNKMLNELKEVIEKDELTQQDSNLNKHKLLHLIKKNINSDEDWEIFEHNFAKVHKDFLEKLKDKYPDITTSELRLAAYIKMDLSSKEIAPLLNISIRSVENKRYRLRKKMGITHDHSLSDHLLRF